jgi:hypothetical protein
VALSQAQILEHVLKEFIVITAMAKGTSETPITAEDVARPIADNEKFEAELSKHTLGQLIRTAKLYLLTARSQDLEANLIQSLNDRNRLVHHFFWDNAVELQSAHGRRKMRRSSKEFRPNSREPSRILKTRTRPCGRLSGLLKRSSRELSPRLRRARWKKRSRQSFAKLMSTVLCADSRHNARGRGVGGVVEKLEDILTRFGNNVASSEGQSAANTEGQGARPALLSDRHPNRDFFIADILEWALKDDGIRFRGKAIRVISGSRSRIHQSS